MPLIPFKGPVLGWLAYHSLTPTPVPRFGFFTPQEYIPRATSLLKRVGVEGKIGQREERAEHMGDVPANMCFSGKRRELKSNCIRNGLSGISRSAGLSKNEPAADHRGIRRTKDTDVFHRGYARDVVRSRRKTFLGAA